MLRLYRGLLHLYPAEHREQFGEEMLAVFAAIHQDAANKGMAARGFLTTREAAGLLIGAFQQHVRGLFGPKICLPFTTRRFSMRTGFRFPKTTAVLMTLILAGVLMIIRQGEGIEASVASVEPNIIHLRTNLLPEIAMGLAAFWIPGFLGWSILFAMRRSGVHRLNSISGEQK
jgi:hypothetical protein